MLTLPCMNKKSNPLITEIAEGHNGTAFSRKQFLKLCGLSAGAAVIASSCTEVPNAVEVKVPPIQIQPDPDPNNGRIWIGMNDVALLNTMHIFSSLAASFYQQVLANPYPNMTVKESSIITGIKNHEIAHSNFWAALLGDSAVSNVHFNFRSINLANRNDVLKAAFEFENYSVSMVNNFPPLLERDTLFEAFTKIGSVEARHAVAIGYLLSPQKAFIISPDGQDVQNNPRDVWNFLNKFIDEDFDLQGLPRY